LKNKVTASAPGKLMLFGEHAVVYGRPCLVTAVDRRIKVSVELLERNEVVISAPEVGITSFCQRLGDLGKKPCPKEVIFVSRGIKNFFAAAKIKNGLKIATKSDFSSQFGFGSSSAVTVATLKALSELFGKKLTKQALFDIGYRTVLEIQGVGSGFDLAAAIWGGTLCFVAGGKKIEPVKVGQLPIVVGYTGIKADTPTLVRKVATYYQSNRILVDAIFDSVEKIVIKAREALENRDYPELGVLMDQNQDFLEKLGVNCGKLNRLIEAARKAGAYGAKLSGAGGGDCMIAVVSDENRKRVKSGINAAGGLVLKVKINAEGVRVE